MSCGRRTRHTDRTCPRLVHQSCQSVEYVTSVTDKRSECLMCIVIDTMYLFVRHALMIQYVLTLVVCVQPNSYFTCSDIRFYLFRKVLYRAARSFFFLVA